MTERERQPQVPESPDEGNQAQVGLSVARRSVKEVLAMELNIPKLRAAEALVLQILLESGEIRTTRIAQRLITAGIGHIMAHRAVRYIERLEARGLIRIETRRPKRCQQKFVKLSQYGRKVFMAWKSFGRECIK